MLRSRRSRSLRFSEAGIGQKYKIKKRWCASTSLHLKKQQQKKHTSHLKAIQAWKCDSTSSFKVTSHVSVYRLVQELDRGLSGGLQHVGQSGLIILLRNMQNRLDEMRNSFVGAVVMHGPATPGWKQSLMLDPYRYRKMLMLFRSSQLAQINLTRMSLIKFPHRGLAPLPSSVCDLIPSVLGGGLWRAAGVILHRGRHSRYPPPITPPFSLFFLDWQQGFLLTYIYICSLTQIGPV